MICFHLLSLSWFFLHLLLFEYFCLVFSSIFFFSLSLPLISTCSLLFFSFLTSQFIFIVLPPHSHPSSLSSAPFLFIPNMFHPFSFHRSLLLPFFILLPYSHHFTIVCSFCCFFFQSSCLKSYILDQNSASFPLFLFLLLLQHFLFLYLWTLLSSSFLLPELFKRRIFHCD